MVGNFADVNITIFPKRSSGFKEWNKLIAFFGVIQLEYCLCNACSVNGQGVVRISSGREVYFFKQIRILAGFKTINAIADAFE